MSVCAKWAYVGEFCASEMLSQISPSLTVYARVHCPPVRRDPTMEEEEDGEMGMAVRSAT